MKITMETEKFKNSLLLIYFNYPHLVYLTEFIKKLYSKHFKTIIFFSNCYKKQEEKTEGEITYVCTYCGTVTEAIFPIFYEKYNHLFEDSDGLMFTMDDCILNTKILNMYYSPEKIIFDYDKNQNPAHLFKPIEEHAGWQWERPNQGKDAILNLLQDPEYKNNYNIKLFSGGYSDRFYLPKRYLTEQTFNLFKLFSKYYVFIELAIPSTIHYIEQNKEQYQQIHYEDILWNLDRDKQYTNKDLLIEAIKTKEPLFIHPIRTHNYPFTKDWLLELLT